MNLDPKSHFNINQISSIPKPQKPIFQFPPTGSQSLQLKLKRTKAYSSRESKGNGGHGAPRVDFRWVELILDPNPDNMVAVGLTGLLAMAGVRFMWQLFVVTMAILIAAIKYTVVGGLLIFIVIALL